MEERLQSRAQQQKNLEQQDVKNLKVLIRIKFQFLIYNYRSKHQEHSSEMKMSIRKTHIKEYDDHFLNQTLQQKAKYF